MTLMNFLDQYRIPFRFGPHPHPRPHSFLVQDLRWPPYRVDNLTSLGIRYRQTLSSSDASRVPAASNLGIASGGIGGGEGARAEGELPWDALGPQAAAPYTWDQPVGDSRVLSVGFEQVMRFFVRYEGAFYCVAD